MHGGSGASRDPTDGTPLLTLAALPASRVFEVLESSPEGLSPEQAAHRLQLEGPNRLPRPEGPGLWRQLLAQLIHFFAIVLWVAAVLAFIAGMPELGVAIIVVITVNGLFSFIQEYRAERATQALAALLPPLATVLRHGRRMTISAEELVTGDLMLLHEGDRISCDAWVIQAEGLRVDNALLTGESEPVERVSELPPMAESALLQAADLVFAGSFVAAGSGRAVAAATGARTQLAAITRLTAGVQRRPSPLRRDIHRAVRVIAAFSVTVGLVFFVISLLLGEPARDALLFTVGVIVALVPEGLLPTLTLSLSMGATRMARRRALVRHLEAVENLGATTVICSDKTGTVTTSEMTVRRLWAGGRHFTVTGLGYNPRGTVLHEGRPLNHEEASELGPMLQVAALCGDARIEQREGRWRCLGDPVDGALLVLAMKGGVMRTSAERSAHRIRELPFDSHRRRMSTVHVLPSGDHLVLSKGSPESILEVCTAVAVDGSPQPMIAERRSQVIAEAEVMAADGLRVMALAQRVLPAATHTAATALESDLVLLGLAAMEDPVRPEVPHALAQCRRAGIRVLMITGDHPATAAVVARKAGFSEGEVRLGADLPEDDAALGAMLFRTITVVARVAPEQKLRIARALQNRGEVVAMTGDGVNDAPALRQADIGIAMGCSGTDVAREAADLVLLDDNFAHIVAAIEEGRAAFSNIRRFLSYHLTDNVAELAPFAVWALSGGTFPLVLSVLQILALDIGTDLLPALALGAERPDPGIMGKPPRLREERLLSSSVLARAFGFLGPLQAVLSLSLVPIGAVLLFAWTPGQPIPAQAVATLSTLVFTAIVLQQMINAFECRRTPASIFQIGLFSNRLLVASVAVEALVLLAFIYAPGLNRILGNVPLAANAWLLVLVSPLLFLSAEELRKSAVRAATKSPPSHSAP